LARDKAKIDRHIVQWKHNRDLIGQLPASHPDWIVTVIFYTAVQAVDAVLAFEEVTAWNHDKRFKAIASLNRLSKLGRNYHTLYDLSRKVRYMADPNLWIPPNQIDKAVVRGLLLPLENSAATVLGRDLTLPELDLTRLSAAPS